MFPGPHATIYRNEVGEVLGWSDESSYEPDYDEAYCDYCEQEGHSFRSCPARDDESLEAGE